MSYKEWGDPHNPKVLICVHGITRVGDDFDFLAQQLAHEYRVVCPDVVGRGHSDYLLNPDSYQIAQYVADMVSLIARLGVEKVSWLGTSMGGLIGMVLASMPKSPIARLIINDVGPNLNFDALMRICDYLGEDIIWDDYNSAKEYIQMVSQPFGEHTHEQWDKLASDVLRQNEQGKWKKHYDVRLAKVVKASTPESVLAGQTQLWASYNAITCPTDLIRGAQSDLLSQETAMEMTRTGPRATLHQIEGVGHAPMFQQVEQVALVRKILS
jgi:pimeloyl-ACP methyl ester carboxylesterase